MLFVQQNLHCLYLHILKCATSLFPIGVFPLMPLSLEKKSTRFWPIGYMYILSVPPYINPCINLNENKQK